MGILRGVQGVSFAIETAVQYNYGWRMLSKWAGYSGRNYGAPIWNSVPLPGGTATNERLWSLKSFSLLASSTLKQQSNAVKFSVGLPEYASQPSHHTGGALQFIRQFHTPSIAPMAPVAASPFSHQLPKSASSFIGSALLGRTFYSSSGVFLVRPTRHALSPPSSVCPRPSAGQHAAARRAFASEAPPQKPQSWLQRLKSQTRSAVSQPRNVTAGVSERGAAAFDALTGTGARYRHALGLQLAGFWNRNSLLLFGAIGLAVILLLWRLMFGIASVFLNFSEWMADLGFLALASSMVLLGGLYLRRRMTINPDSVYRQVMRQVNTFPAALEVLGAPLTGSDVRAYVMSGGGVRMRGLAPKFTRKRAYLIFPVRGSERRGLVSVEAKKRKGKYEFKLISVDVPTASGLAEQRLYLVGDDVAYQKAGKLINELRDPIIQAMAMEHQFEEEDDKEDEEEAKEARENEAREFQEKLAKEAAELQAEAEAREREKKSTIHNPKT